MNHVELLNHIADQCAAQYGERLMGIVGSYARILDSGDPTTGKARLDLRRSLDRSNLVFLTGFDVQTVTYAHEVKAATLNAMGVSLSAPDMLALNEHVVDLAASLNETVCICVRRDSLLAERELRKFALSVNLLESSTGISHIGALIKSKYGAIRELPFMQPDRLGRKRTSEAFVRNAVRHEMVGIHVETALFAIAKGGNDLAQVLNQDGSKGEVFSITSLSRNYRSYEDIKGEVFHPNSTATVIPFKE